MDIGGKIKDLRIQQGLTQEELANRCELSKGFISQIENDLTSPSISTLMDMLLVLGTNLPDFFNEKQKSQIVYKKEDIFVNEDDELSSSISWLIPNAQKNKMEPILIELLAEGRTKEFDPHEGEVFGYVLSGRIIFHLGSQKYTVRKGESFYIIKPKTAHYISNATNKKTKFIWVSTPPLF